jgi:pimeloyl-ACP methyl ester carboxylesterase
MQLQRKLDIKLQSLHYEISGNGQPLVLIHGLGSASTVWKPIRNLLNQSFQVISVDLPGHGKSPYVKGQPMDPHSLAGYVLEQLSAIQVDSFHLSGNSLGGWVAMEMASCWIVAKPLQRSISRHRFSSISGAKYREVGTNRAAL